MMKCIEIRSTDGNPAMIIGLVEGYPTPEQGPDVSTNCHADLDRRLDLALEETFPASDPVSIICC
jgi:hypothetical protein